MIGYLYNLKKSKIIVWCYLIWYLTMVYFYFDPSITLWINSLGVSLVVGTALLLIISDIGQKCEHWQIFRMYLTPFCVSSFTALTKDWDFIIFIADNRWHNIIALILCSIFTLFILSLKFYVERND